MSDPRTPAEIRYDAERSGALYTKPDTAPPATPTERGYWTTPLGMIDGLPVTGHYDNTMLFSAALEWHGLQISTDGVNYLNLDIDDIALGETGESVGDLSFTDWARLRALTQTDIVERLVALAADHTTATPPA
jgi:hypothetical protein